MKKLLSLGLMAILPLVSCGNNQQDSKYKNTLLEDYIVTFLQSRGVFDVDRIEPLHYIDYADVDNLNFHDETEDDYACLEARVSQTDIEQQLLDSFNRYGWDVPATMSEYGWEIVDPNLKVEIDVYFDDAEDYYGTWIYAYSYADLYGDPSAITELERDILEFLATRGVDDYEGIEPLHYIDDTDVTEKKFVEESNENLARFEAKVSTSDIESDLIESFDGCGWTVSDVETEYGWECVDPYELIEIDFSYSSTSGYIGTWIRVYAYADVTGESSAIDIGNALTVTFSEVGLENAEECPLFLGDYIYIEFGEGDQETCKYYSIGNAVRIYGGASITIGGVDSNIKKIEFTWDGDKLPNSDYTVSGGNYNSSTSTWTGNAAEVTLTRNSGGGHWRLQSITVTLA